MDKKNVCNWAINLISFLFLVLSIIGFKCHKDGMGSVGLILGFIIINIKLESVIEKYKRIKKETFDKKVKLALNILSISSLSISILVYVLATDFGVSDIQTYDTLAGKIFVGGFSIAFFVGAIRGILFKEKLFGGKIDGRS